jgi:enolase-phosphatase E1
MIRAILTDIEGTTTSISFVFDVLFPYARAHIADYVRVHAGEPAVRTQLDAVAAEAGRDLTLDEAIDQLIAWIDADRKVTPLKALQGMIWADGYRDGAFTGHVYPDAVAKLREWQAAGIELYVYSSGSVQAQQLLFGYSDAGDLTPLFKGWFDTRVGGKREADSYVQIAAQIGRPAEDILFLSDIVEELDAARAAGMATTRLVRDAQPASDASHLEVASFAAINP